jgi:hypothetical protein
MSLNPVVPLLLADNGDVGQLILYGALILASIIGSVLQKAKKAPQAKAPPPVLRRPSPPAPTPSEERFPMKAGPEARRPVNMREVPAQLPPRPEPRPAVRPIPADVPLRTPRRESPRPRRDVGERSRGEPGGRPRPETVEPARRIQTGAGLPGVTPRQEPLAQPVADSSEDSLVPVGALRRVASAAPRTPPAEPMPTFTTTDVQRLLLRRKNLHAAIVLSEILAPPVTLREDRY